jgi:CRISPR-associated protein Csd1
MQASGKKDGKEVPIEMLVPERVTARSGVGVRANFLCDNAAYILGLDTKGSPKRTAECFEACRKLHFDVLTRAESDAARAVINYFTEWEPKNAETHPKLQPYLDDIAGANIVFLFDDRFVHKDIDVVKAWRGYRPENAANVEMRCLVTGDVAQVAILHSKIKGVYGAQSSGASIVSFNKRAYESYGRDGAQGLNAPVSEYAMFAYTTALNRMLADRRHKRQIGDMTVIYWGEKANSSMRDIFYMFTESREPDADEEITAIMSRIAMGQYIRDPEIKGQFYVLGLSPNAARLSVRLFWQGEFGDMLGNLYRHYKDIEVVKAPYEREYLSVSDLLYETVNTKSKTKRAAPQTAGELLRSVLSGAPYPDTIYYAILRRLKAEHKVTRGRVAVIKAYLTKKNPSSKGECLTVALDKNNRNKAYLLGRLFASLESIQQATNPNINSTIKDRYFNAACATPQKTFVYLLKLSNFHVKKLLREKRGLAITLEKEKGEIFDLLDAGNGMFPVRLSLEEQGMFIGGYYHQTQEKFRAIKEKNDRDDSGDNDSLTIA